MVGPLALGGPYDAVPRALPRARQMVWPLARNGTLPRPPCYVDQRPLVFRDRQLAGGCRSPAEADAVGGDQDLAKDKVAD